MDELAGKVAIVTGGASGLGYATVERFVAEGAKVVIADVNERGGQQLASTCGSSAYFQRADVSAADEMCELVETAVTRFGALDVMVNNAGISSRMHRSFLDDDLADFHKVMGVNLLGVMLGTREAARHMAANDGGSIINVSSIGGLQPGGGVMAYRASKAAVIHFTRSVATELAEYGIRVNCLAPGGIPTPILASSMQGMSSDAVDRLVRSVREKMRNDRPLPREGTPEDVAQAALYYASDHSASVTGTVLPIDGGTSAISGPIASG
jgi:NAD(P)-dependent dehydrogenase (short-subunit alcohol dehydrogenase family)